MQLDRLFHYDDWGNREEVSRIKSLGNPASALRLLGHIIGAQWLWIARLIPERPTTMAVWPELTIAECQAELDALRSAWTGILRGVELTRKIEYTNSRGEAWTSVVDDVLMHVVMHGAYHRGQIATVTRQSGEVPAYTDFIHAVRNGAV